MHHRLMGIAIIGAAVLLAAGGCEPQRAKGPAWTNPLDAAEARLVKDPNDKDYVLSRMEFGRLAILLGSPLRAKPRLMEAFEQLDVEHENVGAAISSEQFKYYKGETYERAMLCIYLATIEYQTGDTNNTRIFLSRALTADRAAVVKDSTPREVGEDFGLAFYWLGKTYARLDDTDNCTIAFRKATTPTPRKEKDAARELKDDRRKVEEWLKLSAEGERWTYETFHSPEKPERFIDGIVNLADVRGSAAAAPAALPGAAPDNPIVHGTDKPAEFFTPDYQADSNLVLTIDVGRCPFKYLGGISGERTEFGRFPILPHAVRVYIDGHDAGPAFKVLDLWDQAATQDRIGEKEAAQTGKALLKELLKQAPMGGSLAGHWDVSGDVRHWTSLPGRVYVFAAKVTPGVHSVRLEMFDVNGNALPRWTNTWHGVAVPKTGEMCLLLNPFFDGNNRLPPDEVQKAIKGGARPGLPAMAWTYY